jgi:hypothetical protein
MSGTWISLAIEGLVAFLLVVTIAYCAVLNQRLKRLKADESGLRKTITELVLATEIAERAINGLKHAAVECDKTLGKRVREAEYFSIEIAREVGEGAAVLDRIRQITQTARATAQPVVAEPVTADAEPTLGRAAELKRRALETSERLNNLRRGTEKAA